MTLDSTLLYSTFTLSSALISYEPTIADNLPTLNKYLLCRSLKLTTEEGAIL
jgi:hypothetical protein